MQGTLLVTPVIDLTPMVAQSVSWQPSTVSVAVTQICVEPVAGIVKVVAAAPSWVHVYTIEWFAGLPLTLAVGLIALPRHAYAGAFILTVRVQHA